MGNVKVTVHNEQNAGKEETGLERGPQPRNAAEGTWGTSHLYRSWHIVGAQKGLKRNSNKVLNQKVRE